VWCSTESSPSVMRWHGIFPFCRLGVREPCFLFVSCISWFPAFLPGGLRVSMTVSQKTVKRPQPDACFSPPLRRARFPGFPIVFHKTGPEDFGLPYPPGRLIFNGLCVSLLLVIFFLTILWLHIFPEGKSETRRRGREGVSRSDMSLKANLFFCPFRPPAPLQPCNRVYPVRLGGWIVESNPDRETEHS
jgi:hypothetical protein